MCAASPAESGRRNLRRRISGSSPHRTTTLCGRPNGSHQTSNRHPEFCLLAWLAAPDVSFRRGDASAIHPRRTPRSWLADHRGYRHLIRPSLAGPNGNRTSLIIVLAVGVAVTSVPVVSKIFADLKILHTRFARLVLGVAVLEDKVLWLALALATATAGAAVLDPRKMAYHLIVT